MAANESPVSGSSSETASEPKITPFTLLVGTIIHPVATFKQLREAQRGYWWFVLLLTAIVAVALSLATSSAMSRAATFTVIEGGKGGVVTQGGPNPEGPSGGRANGGGEFSGARQAQTTLPLLLVVGSLVGGAVLALLDYGLRALLVFLTSMLMGGKAAFKEVFRMAAWTTLPAAIRGVVQTVAVLVTGGLVAPGFSAALTLAETRTLPIVNLLLGYMDIYTLWSALLLGIGAAITGRLSKGKAAISVAVYIGVSLVIILVYFSVTSAISGALGGGNGRGAAPGGGRVRIGG